MRPAKVRLLTSVLLCFTLLLFPVSAKQQGRLPFATDLELNIRVFRELSQTEGPGSKIVQEEKDALLAQARQQLKPVSAAYLHFLYARYLSRTTTDPLACLPECQAALTLLTECRRDDQEFDVKARDLYREVVKHMLMTCSRDQETSAGLMGCLFTYYTDSRISTGALYREGLEIAKVAEGDYYFRIKDYSSARRLYHELEVAFPRSPQMSAIKDKLRTIERELNSPLHQRFLAAQGRAFWSFLIVCGAFLVIIIWIDRMHPTIRLLRCNEEVLQVLTDRLHGRLERGMRGEGLFSGLEESAGDPPVFRSTDWHHTDPIAYLLAYIRPKPFRLFIFGVAAMLGVHFLAAWLDNNLYYGQDGLRVITGLLAGDFDKAASTFLTIPHGYQPSQREYFFNDYYGLMVNGLVNPLILVILCAIYVRFTRIWNTLLEENTIRIAGDEASRELCGFMIRIFNRRWLFWVSFLVPLLLVFSTWHDVYNQPDRGSYLDFGEGIMPYIHGIYLLAFWHMLVMLGLKLVVSTIVINTVFNTYVDKKKVRLALRPLHPDRCAGLSTLGSYVLLLHLVVILSALSMSARVFFDFILVGTSIQKQPQILFQLLVMLFFSPIVFFMPLYLVRERTRRVKRRMLKELNDEYTFQGEKFRKLLQGRENQTDQFELGTLDYMAKIKELHKPVQEIPEWPFDARTISTFAGTLFLPIVLPLALDFIKRHIL